jgi:3'-phosphoadenosine 5'-phosphosulfate sulfotransferase (PAPS reductase)/FAD synthetase
MCCSSGSALSTVACLITCALPRPRQRAPAFLLVRACGLAGKLGYLESGKAKVMVVDTFHLFDDTMPFLAELEEKYKFKAEIFQVMALLCM